MGRMSIQESLFAKYLRIFVVIASYWAVSISLVFINKYLLSGKDVKLDAPLFVTCFQCVISLILCIVLRCLSQLFPSVFFFPPIHLNVEILKKVLPLSIIFVAMITFNNLCLKYVGVAFYYIGRSLTTVFNVGLTFLLLHEKTTPKAIACCVIIVSGFFLGVNQEGAAGSLSIIGLIYGILASLFVSLYSIYIKKVLPLVDGSVWLLTLFNNINGILLFLPMILLFGEIKELTNFKNIADQYFWLLMMAGGVFGFAIAYMTGLQIKVTSPLTHNISGTAKACAQTILAVAWFHDSKSLLWWLSNFVVLFGSAAYTRVRQVEMMKDFQEKLKTIKKDVESQESLLKN